MMKQFNQRQPDKGGIRGSAKATISLPLAQPAANKTSSENTSTSKTNTEDAKGSVRHLLHPCPYMSTQADTEPRLSFNHKQNIFNY
jgi:hypothetical protein